MRKDSPSKICESNQLYNNFAEGQDKVEGIEGLAVAARHTGRGQKRKKVATQNQVIVRWAPTVMQGWVVELAKQKGYHVTLMSRCLPKAFPKSAMFGNEM